MNKKFLIEKKNSLIAQMEELTNKVEIETRALSQEELNKFEDLKKQVEEINSTISILNEKINVVEEPQKEGEQNMENRNFENELRAITSSTHGDAIPEGLHGDILRKIEEKSNVYADAKKVDFVGDLAILVDGESAEAAILAETEELTETELGEVEKVVLKDKRVATLVTVSKHMLNNSPALTMEFIADKVATRVANTIEKQIFNAQGSSKQFTSGLIQKGTKVVGDVSIDSILKMVGGMKSAYLNGAKLYCNRETFGKLCALKNATGHPYLVADVIKDKPAYSLMGVEIAVTDVLSADVLVLANLGEAVMVKHGQAPQVEVLNETFALKGSVGIMCEAYVDCAVVNNDAVVVLSAE